VIVLARIVFNSAIRMVYPFLPVFSRSLGVDIKTLSSAVSLRSAAGALGPFLASVADSRSRKTGMLFGVLLFTIGVGVIAIKPTFPMFVLFLILSLVGNLVFVPAMQAYFGDWIPYRQRGLVMSLTEYGWSLSFLIGVPLIGFLIARYNWWSPFPFLTGLGVFFFLALFFILPGNSDTPTIKPNIFRNIKSILTHPPALAGIMIAILISCSNELVNLIFGVWLEDTFAVQISALAMASAVIGFAELGGEAIVSLIVDKLGKKRSVFFGISLNAIACLSLPLLSQNLIGAYLGLFFFYLTFEFTLVSSIPMMSELYPPARATMLSLNIAGMAIGRAVGAQLSPFLYEIGMAKFVLFSGLGLVILGSIVLDFFAILALKVIPHESVLADEQVSYP